MNVHVMPYTDTVNTQNFAAMRCTIPPFLQRTTLLLLLQSQPFDSINTGCV
jgi:hypothetical protein